MTGPSLFSVGCFSRICLRAVLDTTVLISRTVDDDEEPAKRTREQAALSSPESKVGPRRRAHKRNRMAIGSMLGLPVTPGDTAATFDAIINARPSSRSSSMRPRGRAGPTLSSDPSRTEPSTSVAGPSAPTGRSHPPAKLKGSSLHAGSTPKSGRERRG